MSNKLTIRMEQDADRSKVATLLAKTYRAQGVKAIEMAGELRRARGEKQQLSYIGELEGVPVACAMFAPVVVNGQDEQVVVLASMGVDIAQLDLDVQSFLQGAMDKVKSQGLRYVLLQGDASEFASAGFVKSQDVGLELPPSENGQWLVKDLTPNAGNGVQGKVDLPTFLR